MDARVNDFLNEINEIAPLNETKSDNTWEKCYDEESGYYYYWNTKTNEVTWDTPSEAKVFSKIKTKKTPNLYIPPRTAPLFPSTSILPPVSDAIKIYKIGESTDSISSSNVKGAIIVNEVLDGKDDKNKSDGSKNEGEENKVVLISSYGADSESEEERPLEVNKKPVNGSKTLPSLASEDEDDVDIVTKIQRKAFEPKKPEKAQFSLVVGYSDSEEEPEPPEEKVAHSTLFPVSKPIDPKDFGESPKIPESEGFDPKAFQRKRRIGVALVNTGKKLKADDEGERKGLGFSSDSNSGDNFSNVGSTYPGFKSGGVMFVKADVINPSQVSPAEKNSQEPENLKEIEDIYTTLKEKLKFLSEGREEVSPVQVMLIQIETLHTALKSGDLKQTYLRKWLEETCSDLIKLEKETTPEGWLLQWDRRRREPPQFRRTHKRYYYQNASTGASQWEYPQADVTGCDEAMDICTTPPPNGAEPTIQISPPLPPVIRSPSPPPPPSISNCKPSKQKCDIPLPVEPKEPVPTLLMTVEGFENNGEPLPPGVDAFDENTKAKDAQTADLNDVLSSFYSDIAAIETVTEPPIIVDEKVKIEAPTENPAEQTKKKKKTKVKLAQGIAMKKKGVSKLVEKWKNVQMSYND